MSEAIDRANRVQHLLDNKDLQQAFEDTRNAILQMFQEIPPSKTEELVKCRERLHLLKSVKENLYEAVQQGKLEAFRVEEEKRMPYLGDILKWRMKR